MEFGWKITTDKAHTVTLELKGTKEILRVDGKIVSDQKSAGIKSDHTFAVGSEHVDLRIRLGFPARPKPTLVVRGKELPPDWPPPPPMWVWLFAVPCFAMVAFGGAIPVGLGAGAGMGCLAVAKNDKRSTATRVGLCSAIVAGAWLALGGVVVALNR